MTNDQIPMTNEKGNNQLNKEKGGTDRPYHFGLLIIVCLSGYWNLVVGHYLTVRQRCCAR